MNQKTGGSESSTTFKVILQVIESAVFALEQGKIVVTNLSSNPHAILVADRLVKLYSQLPESVSFALTGLVVFLSTLLLLRAGRNILSFVLLIFQLGLMLAVGFVIWKLRAPLLEWLDRILEAN
jgi:uncharacterized membrane protein